jgi:hypothetical protein
MSIEETGKALADILIMNLSAARIVYIQKLTKVVDKPLLILSFMDGTGIVWTL